MAIWTVGIKPGQFVQDLELPTKKRLDTGQLPSKCGEEHPCHWRCRLDEDRRKLATKTGLEAERQAKYLAGHFRNMIKGRPFEKYSVRASTDSQVALTSLGADSAVGVVGKTCIGVPTRLIYPTFRSKDCIAD